MCILSIKNNKWKGFFFLSILLNAVLLTPFILLLFLGSGSGYESDLSDAEGGNSLFSIELTRDELNRIIEKEVDQSQLQTYAGEEALRLEASFNVIGRDINAEMEFEPNAMEDGNVELEEKSFTIGGLSLPGTEVLALFESQVEWPEYVVVDPPNDRIVIDMQEIEVGEGYRIRADTIDLENDIISFKVTD
ncbi:YpmS family protein [Alteribacillus sp. HJP-4]|uniref:YpmS family protein n=1 Tax=Alteribacillus sp. HJP-4 TaxID=2775394 RepID=UPI0035CCF5BC